MLQFCWYIKSTALLEELMERLDFGKVGIVEEPIRRRRRYTGRLKLVSADTDARYFNVVLDPYSEAEPCTITPSKIFDDT
jgi:hypothetical protein